LLHCHRWRAKFLPHHAEGTTFFFFSLSITVIPKLFQIGKGRRREHGKTFQDTFSRIYFQNGDFIIYFWNVLSGTTFQNG